jgi:hypothetical protein
VTGAVTPTFFALLADRFGSASFGTVRGLTLPILSAGGMLGARFGGEAYDRSGGYALMFQGFVVVLALCALTMASTRMLDRTALNARIAKPPPA